MASKLQGKNADGKANVTIKGITYALDLFRCELDADGVDPDDQYVSFFANDSEGHRFEIDIDVPTGFTAATPKEAFAKLAPEAIANAVVVFLKG
jgi:hypothetical protein